MSDASMRKSVLLKPFTGKTVPLEELCISITDCPHSTPKWCDDGLIVVRNFNIKDGSLDLSNPSYTDKDSFKERIKRAKPEAGDIIITREAPMGQVCMIPEGVECCLGQRMVLIKINTKKVTSEYLSFALQSEFVQKQIKKSDKTGSIVSNLCIPDLKALDIPLPNSSVEIALTLSSILKKIELNNRINAELEAMAKTLYDYWFVQFDFPDANGKPYKTSGGKMEYNATLKREIPAGWYDCELRELIDMEYGKPLKTDIRTGHGYPVFGSNGTIDFHQQYLIEGPGIIIGRKGTIGKISYSFDNFYPIDTTYYVKPKNKKISMIFLKFLLTSLGMEKMNTDSAVPGLNREATLGLSVVAILPELIENFHTYADLWFKKKKLILEENRELIKLRDWLLPLLMNGQVTVK
ncbi:restriction endonuclease subunit S [Dickeya dianthicola]|uniref:restriction endonuclease subunit S n=1 Tax=Dickeya dianthicola TaxID=204039 RepID=UPI00301AD4BA